MTEVSAPENEKLGGREQPPEIVDGRYRVLQFLGGGGMGEVYEVEHLSLRRRFALKRLRTEFCREARLVERFRRESLAAASVTSEHVVSIVDSGTLKDGAPYFVMERLIGEDLRSVLRRGPLLPARAAAIGIDACCGLRAAHEAGLVHRDLKPENLFITKGDDGRDVCKLLDFGVAKLLCESTAKEEGTTLPGTLIGTARYMAPEQAGTDSPLGPRADIFSLAVILYECLTGVAPFEADTLERLLFKIMKVEPEPLHERDPALPRSLAEAVTRALSKDPGARFATALDFAEALAETAPRHGLRRGAVVRGLDIPRESGVADADGTTAAHGSARGQPPASGARLALRRSSRKAMVAIPVVAVSVLAVSAFASWSRGTRSTARPTQQGPVTTAPPLSSAPEFRETESALLPNNPADRQVGTALALGSDMAPSAAVPGRTLAAQRPAARDEAQSPLPTHSPQSVHPPVVTFDPQNPYARRDNDTAKPPQQP